MGRPKEPLISKERAVAAALEIIDEQGIDRFSLRKLGAKLGVHGMSLYHHFKDKDEILENVAALVLSDLRATPPPDDDIAAWTLVNAKRYRRALLNHPNAMPLFVERFPVRSRSAMYVHEFDALARLGIDEGYWMVIVETIEAFVLGSALFLREAGDPMDFSAAEDGEREVRKAIDSRSIDYDQAFDTAVLVLVHGLHETYRTKRSKARR